MVRLKVLKKCATNKGFAWFQFQNGAIKSEKEFGDRTLAIMFQFQNGAIKRKRSHHYLYVNTQFQFQNGAIKSKLPKTVFNALTKFQFQNGAIKRSSFLKPLGITTQVSIPKWCD